MDEEVIEIEDYEVKEKSLISVDDEDENEDNYSKSSSSDYSYDNGSSTVSWTVISGYKLWIIVLVIILLLAIGLLMFC